ncbi:MAG: RHS repeat-associated core domain-containing protein, partial [Motilibacteraceae bacterium]
GTGTGTAVAATGASVQLHNLHGDVVATMDAANPGASITSYTESTEFGVPRDPSTAYSRYGWLGDKQRSSDDLAGLVLMGVRQYNPVTGRFLSVDSVAGGNENKYSYPVDPLNGTDLSGRYRDNPGGSGYGATKQFYSYHYSYFLQNTTKSASSVMQAIEHNFGVFPLAGCGKSLREGSRCKLTGGNPIYVADVSATSFSFVSLPGHAEGAYNAITFSVKRRGTALYLDVVAAGPGTRWQHLPGGRLANHALANAMWSLFSSRIRGSILGMGCRQGNCR